MKILTFTVGLLLLPALGLADNSDPRSDPTHYVTAFYGRSQLIFGSEDNRFGGGIAFGYGRPEPRFANGSIAAQMVYETYVDHTQSPGGGGIAPNSTFAGGVLAYSRWLWPTDQYGNGVYADLGWGFQVATETTLDLESIFNSTPVLGFGGIFKDGNHDYLVGIRYLHISNAGFVKPNYGQNELFLTIGFRY